MRLSLLISLATLSLFGTTSARAVQIVTNETQLACTEYQLSKPLRIYRDPALFLNNVAMMQVEPGMAWESMVDESPILTEVRGHISLMKLGKESPFRNFRDVAKIYEAALPRRKVQTKGTAPKIIPVRVCDTAYSDALGFVFVDELAEAQIEEGQVGKLPPSTRKNPIPNYAGIATPNVEVVVQSEK